MKTPFNILFAVAALAAIAIPAHGEGPDATDGRGVESATFSMYCYWTGEATLGKVDGVVASRIGHLGGKEIVRVDYDPARTDLGELTEALKQQRSFYSLIATDGAEAERAKRHLPAAEVELHHGHLRFIEPKHSLRTRHPELAALDLSESQAIALNSWSYFGGPMPDVLTDEQKRRLKKR